jgi:hypothetical protein
VYIRISDVEFEIESNLHVIREVVAAIRSLLQPYSLCLERLIDRTMYQSISAKLPSRASDSVRSHT